jgi:hypothetical protein
MHAPLVFRCQQPGETQWWRIGQWPVLLFFTVLLVLALLALIWILLPSREVLAHVDWSAVWQKMLNKPAKLVELGVCLFFGPLALWAQMQQKKHARLTLSARTLQYASGLPLLGRWLDWSLDLDAVRADKLALRLSGVAMGAQPLRNYRLTWGVGSLRQLRPAAWYLPGQAAVKPLRPRSFLGLVRWQAPDNKALLQQQFAQLPLVRALRERSVVLPPMTDKRQDPNLDLLAYPRMKVAVISFFAAIVLAFILFHLMRHQHYFVQPPVITYIAFGALVGLAALAWLWQELQAGGPSLAPGATAGGALGFRSTQLLLAALVAVAAGLCAPSLPLAFSNLTQNPQQIAFVLQNSPLRLNPKHPDDAPAIAPTQAVDYWLSLADGEVVTLPVRQGVAGLWWQFDSSVLQDQVEAFYAARPHR